MPIYSPTGFLDITNATLRTSNVEAENLLLTGGNIYVTSELETDATVLNLENVTRKGNVSSNTIEITNVTTGIVATGNVHASKFIGSGSHLTGIPPSAITGTLSQWSDGTNGDVYIATNVGIGNVHTLTSNTLQVGGNLYVRDTGSNVLTVNGNVVANYFEGDGSKLSGIVTDLQGVTDNGNVTTNVVQFSNVTTGLVTTANIEVGGDLKIDGLTAGTVPYVAADKFLKDSFITTTGDTTVITSNLDVTGNIFMRGEKFIVESETKLINDAIIGIANNNTSSTTDKGIIMQSPISATTGNVAIIHHGTGDGFANQLTFGYTADPLDTVTVTNDLTKELTVNVLGNVITQNNLSVGGTLSINNITAAAQHSLQAVTNVGNVTSNTVQFSNAITSLVASSNIVATGNVSAGYDTNTTSYFGRAAVGYMGQNNQASFAHVSHNTTSSYALKQTAGGPTYINTPASGHIRFTVNDGNSNAEKMRITGAGKVGIGESTPDATLHVVGNAYVSSDLIVSSDVRGGYDTDTTSYFGRAAVGYCGHIDAMSISHIDSNDTGGYALLQEANGGTILNSASGQPVRLRQGNVDKLTIDSSGNVGIGVNPSAGFHVQTGTSDEVTTFKVGSGGIVTLSRNHGTPAPYMDTNFSSGNPQLRMAWNHSDPKVYLGSLSGTPSLTFRYLTSNENNSGTNTYGKLVLHRSHRSGIGDQVGIQCIRRSGQWDDQADMEFYVTNGNSGRCTAMSIRSTGSTNDSRVGILRTDPDYSLDVFGRIGFCNTVSGKTHQHWHLSGGTDANTGNFYTVYKQSGYNETWRTRIQGSAGNQATLNFTGQHKTYIKDISSERAEELEGLIVSANTNKYMKMSEGVEMGQNAITINESLPIVNISNVSQDKTCFGVISASEDPENVRGETIGCFTAFIHKEDGDTRVHINSVGEGALWVVNTNGPIESGDYITSSNIAGYGMKQESECLMNYTVAKSTMDCDFNPLTQKKRRIVKEERDAVAWVLRKYEEVSEEEYNNTPEDKRKIEDDTFKVEREYVSRHDPDNEDYIKETRTFEFSVLDENKQLVWEDTDETELEYKIRYLDANGNITTEENAIHKAAFIGCTYHCG